MQVKDIFSAINNPDMQVDPVLVDYVNNPKSNADLTNQPSKEEILTQKLREEAAKLKQKEAESEARFRNWQPILYSMPEFLQLSDKGKESAITTLKNNPEKFFEVIKQTPYYKQLSEKGKERLKKSLFDPIKYRQEKINAPTVAEKQGFQYEGDEVSKEVYIDPIGWAGGGVALGMKAIPGIIAGDIVGETTKTIANKLSGHDPYKEENIVWDYMLPLTADVISGILGGKLYEKISKRTVQKLIDAVAKNDDDLIKAAKANIKAEAPEIKDQQLDDLTLKMKAVTEEPKTKEIAEVGADIVDEANDNLDIIPEQLNIQKLNPEDIKGVWDYFEKNIKGREFTSPIGHKVRFKDGHFFRLVAGSQDKSKRKGLVEKAKSSEEAIQLIKEGKLTKDDIFGFEKIRAKYIPAIPDIIERPHLIMKDNKGAYLYVKRYKVNGTDNIVGVFIDVNNKRLGLLSLHPKGWNNIKNGIKKGKYKIIWTPTRSPARGGSGVGGSPEAGSPPTNTPTNNISKNEEIGKNKKLYAGIPTTELFKSISKADELIYKKFTSKIEDSKFDQFARKYLLADKYGFGSLSRSKEDKIIDDYLKLKAHLARGDLSAEKKEKILSKYLDKLDEGARKIREKFMIQYLENPAVRERAKQELPEVAQELDKIRNEIDRLGKLKMERGLISPSQFEKWKDKYLTRLYVMEDEVEGLDITRGLKQYEEKKGRKIESIVDYIEYLKNEDPIKAAEWERKAVLDPIKAVKATLAKSYANLAIDDFYRKMLDDPEIVPQKYLVEMPVKINNLPQKMSPYYAESKVLPYLRDLLRKDRNNKEIREAIRALRKQIKEKKALIEAERQLLEKAGYKVLGDKTKARYSVISGLPVHRDVANMIEGMTRIIENPADTASKIDKAATTALAYFKWAKVPANIFSYPRNMMSNWIQFAMSGADPVSFPEYAGKAVIGILKKDKYYRLAKSWGLFHSNFASEEINKIFREISDSITPNTAPKKAFKMLLKLMSKTGEAYGAIDDIAKLARFRYALEVEKKPINEAIKIAQDTHFDYSLTYPVIRAMRDPNIDRGVFLKLFGTLFPTYTHKVLSFLYDTAIKRPITLTVLLSGFAALKQYIEQINEEKIGKKQYEKLKKLQPEFLDSPFVLPIVDKDGKWITYIDVSYIVPFGNLVNFAHDIVQGEPVEAARELGALSNPVYSFKALAENKDPLTGRPIYYPHNKMQAAKDIAKYSFNQFLAPGTISNLQRYAESKHPAIPRILTGMLFYEYPKEQLQQFKLMQINRIKMDTQREIIKLKKDLQYYARKYRDGKISKDEYESKKKEIISEIRKYQRMGDNAIKEIIESLR